MKRRDLFKSAAGVAAATSLPLLAADNADVPFEIGSGRATEAITRSGEVTTLSGSEVHELQESLRRALLQRGSPRYDDHRKVWNGMWDDKQPALIAECLVVQDVINAVNFAADHDLLVAVRGGGHSISGKSVCDGGIVIDLGAMRGVQVDPVAQTARVEGGALLSDMDRATQEFGLVAPAGVVSHTGVAGLTLGGGIGMLMRKYGLTIDNLLGVEIVTADGKFQTANKDENPDLFWAVRGGGGNFGVVTAFYFRLHKMGRKVLSGGLLFPMDQAKDVFDFYFDWSLNAPSEMHCFAGMTINEAGAEVMMIGGAYAGEDLSKGEPMFEPMRKVGKPIADFIGPRDYIIQQTTGDAHNNHGRVYYIKGRHVNDYDPAMTDTLLERWQHAPGRFTTMRLVRFGGAISQVAADATAWPHRNAVWDLEVGASWANPALSGEYVQWGRDYWDALDPYTADSFYVNELMDEGQDKVAVSYENNYPRLVAIKNKFDPKNLFQLNANIKPTL